MSINNICFICKVKRENHNNENHDFCRDKKAKIQCPNCKKYLQIYYVTSFRHMVTCNVVKPTKTKNKKPKNKLFKQISNKCNETTIKSLYERAYFNYFTISFV